MIQIPGGLHGAYTYGQARGALGEYGLRAAVDSGELIGFGRGVLIAAGRERDLRTRAAGALFLTGPDGVLVGSTAAILYGCTAIRGYPVHVRVPYQHRVRSRAGLVVHQGPVSESDVVHRDGLRVLRPAPLLADLFRSASRRGALACADQILATLPEPARADLRDQVARILADNSDRRGSLTADDLLHLATGRPESPGQSALLVVIVEAGFPPPVCQHPVERDDSTTGHRLDFAWPAELIAIEYDDVGRPSCTARTEVDLRRQGWLILRADAADLRNPIALLHRLEEAFARRQVAA